MTEAQISQAIQFLCWHRDQRKSFNLRYRDAKGERSERATLIYEIRRRSDGIVYIHAATTEGLEPQTGREDPPANSRKLIRRTFRLDRMHALWMRDSEPLTDEQYAAIRRQIGMPPAEKIAGVIL